MKSISIKKVSVKLAKDIIKELPKAISINYKGEKVEEKTPKWFTDWTKKFEKINDVRWQKNEERWEKNEERWIVNENRWKDQGEFNKLIMKRIDNIVKLNSLKE